MRKAYCTIITLDYLHYALALNNSLLAHDKDVQMKVLISDAIADLSLVSAKFPNIEFFHFSELCNDGIAKTIFDKYATTDMDSFRWAMKPIFLMHLLDQNYEQVFFLDCDLYFFASFDFLSDHLKGYGVLLTPHWRASNPRDDEPAFALLQTDGLFNAGFVGVSQDGRAAMHWWATVCAYKCIKAPEKGLFVDQAYLDLMPVYFDNTRIEKHRGCNVAGWNRVECRRVASEDGHVLIQGQWEIVFIHFTKTTIDGIQSGEDRLLRPYLEKYRADFENIQSWLKDIIKISHKPPAHFESAIPELSYDHAKSKNPFLSPKLTPGRLHVYLMRSSIARSLKEHIGEFRGTLLDVGSSQAPYKPLLTSPPSKVTRYVSIDLENSPAYNYHADIAWREGNIPLESESVDGSICIEALERCTEPDKVLREILRVLKPGGLLFFTMYSFWPLDASHNDCNRFTPSSLRRHLAASGYVDINLKPMGGWDASLAQMLGLWAVNRDMGIWMRRITSRFLLPLIYVLARSDKWVLSKSREPGMAPGYVGTAKKSNHRAVNTPSQ